jgi:outer membrane protein OmpA-like peptidoglycan-associated protein
MSGFLICKLTPICDKTQSGSTAHSLTQQNLPHLIETIKSKSKPKPQQPSTIHYDATHTPPTLSGLLPSRANEELSTALSDFCLSVGCQNQIITQYDVEHQEWQDGLIPILNELAKERIDQCQLTIEHGVLTLRGNVDYNRTVHTLTDSLRLYADNLAIDNYLTFSKSEPKLPTLDNEPIDDHEIKQAEIDNLMNGIIEERPLQQLQTDITHFLHNNPIKFEPAKSSIEPQSFLVLDQIYSMLREQTTDSVRIEGHTDQNGNAEDNKVLSQKRADSVRDYLIKKGFNGSKLQSIGYGEEKLLNPADTPEAHRQNRRVEFYLE